MTDRLSLPVHCSSQTKNNNNYHNSHGHILPSTISNTAIKNHARPSTWPSYFQCTVVRLFLSKPIISLPSFLRQDTWSLSSLSEEEDEVEQFKRKSTVSSSLHFPPVPSILWHLYGNKSKATSRHHLPRLDLESPTRPIFPNINKTEGIDMPCHCSLSVKTFHTQSILFLFGFIFFPCWWYGWYLSSASDYAANHLHKSQNSSCCCPNRYQPHCNCHLHDHRHVNYTHYDSSLCAYPVVTNLYHDIYCYSRFNRFLSFVSFFFLLFILALLVWLYWGTIHHWWT